MYDALDPEGRGAGVPVDDVIAVHSAEAAEDHAGPEARAEASGAEPRLRRGSRDKLIGEDEALSRRSSATSDSADDDDEPATPRDGGPGGATARRAAGEADRREADGEAAGAIELTQAGVNEEYSEFV